MESYRGVYAIKLGDEMMYTRVYVTPENIDIDIDISDTLRICAGIEFCHYHCEPIPGVDIAGWTGIHVDLEKGELQVTIYGGCNTPTQTTLLEKTLPISLGNLTEES